MLMTRVLTSSVLAHFIFAHKILEIHLQDQMTYWTVGFYFDLMCPEPQARRKSVMFSGFNAFIFAKISFRFTSQNLNKFVRVFLGSKGF